MAFKCLGYRWRYGGGPAAEAYGSRSSDYTGMLGTVKNALVMADSAACWPPALLRTAIGDAAGGWALFVDVLFRHWKKVGSLFSVLVLVHHISQQTWLLPLRAAELRQMLTLMAKNGVDVIYNADPNRDKQLWSLMNWPTVININKATGIMDSDCFLPFLWTMTLT